MTAPYFSGSWTGSGRRGGYNSKSFREMLLGQLGVEVPGSMQQEADATAVNTGWNAQAATDKVLGAAQNRLNESLGRELDTLAGRAAGMGRLDTGYYNLDQGDVARSVAQDFTNTANSTALQVAGMQQNQNQYNQNAATARRDRSYDLLFSGWDSFRQDRARWDQLNAQKGWFGRLVGGALGTLTGGRAGKAGEKLAEKLF